ERSKKYKVIYCGGTIGQMPDVHGVLHPPKDDAAFRDACAPVISGFIQQTKERLGSDVSVDYQFWKSIDSTNVTPQDWEEMAKMVLQAQGDGYDGVVIAMGTDTIAEASSGVKFLLLQQNKLRIPVDFTAAQLPISRKDGDATPNLTNALKV